MRVYVFLILLVWINRISPMKHDTSLEATIERVKTLYDSIIEWHKKPETIVYLIKDEKRLHIKALVPEILKLKYDSFFMMLL